MIDDIIKMMRERITMAGQPLMLPTETCAVIVNRIENLEKALKSYSCDCLCILTDEDACEMGNWDNTLCGKRARQELDDTNDR